MFFVFHFKLFGLSHFIRCSVCVICFYRDGWRGLLKVSWTISRNCTFYRRISYCLLAMLTLMLRTCFIVMDPSVGSSRILNHLACIWKVIGVKVVEWYLFRATFVLNTPAWKDILSISSLPLLTNSILQKTIFDLGVSRCSTAETFDFPSNVEWWTSLHLCTFVL